MKLAEDLSAELEDEGRRCADEAWAKGTDVAVGSGMKLEICGPTKGGVCPEERNKKIQG